MTPADDPRHDRTQTAPERVESPPGASPPAESAPRRRGGRPKGSGSRPPVDLAKLSAHARTTGVVILEVLAGVRSTGDAAKAIGVSPVRYYAIEARAVHALLVACEPRPSGPATDAELARVVARLREDRKRLEVEAARLRALLRSTQRGLGVPSAPPSPAGVAAGASGKKPRARRPAVRALTAVRRLLRAAGSTTAPPAATPAAEPGGG